MYFVNNNEYIIFILCKYKFPIANGLSQNMFIDFCQILILIANLRLQLTNRYSSEMNVG